MPQLLIKKNSKEFSVIDDDLVEFWGNVSNGLWEAATFAAFNEFIDKSRSYVDIGAWIGPTVLYGAQLARKCYAIEPDPVAFKKLKANIDLNENIRQKIELFNGCISDHSGVERFGTASDFGDSMSSLVFADNAQSIEVTALTLQEYFEKFAITDCSFIKMDIEGGETKVLPHAKEFLKSFKPNLYLSLHAKLFEDQEKSAQELVEALRIYPYLYTPYAEELSFEGLLEDLKTVGRVSEIVAVSSRWNFYQRKKYQCSLLFPRLKRKCRNILRKKAGGK